MTKKPQDSSSSDRKASENAPAVDYVRTKQEVDAAAQQRQAEEERANATGGDDAETSSLHARVKQHAPDDLDPVQSSSDEPLIEDEP